jgi:uncharacterized protein
MIDWKFYGRAEQVVELKRILSRNRWFFAKLTGRRRIGKTTLVHRALDELDRQRPVFYVQIPDSEPSGVLSAIHDAMETFRVSAERHPRPNDLIQLANLFEGMIEDGYILVLDEFQYFNRKGYEEFCSFLQARVDRLAAKASQVRGGLIVMGSIHTEMVALLEDRTAPLFNRVTDTLHLTHLDIGSILLMLQDHAEPSPERLLFLWNLFEGVPKFYRDCYEQGVLGAERKVLLRRIFFESSSPLRSEAENWFLGELRGRYDVILKFVARNPGRMHNELVQAVRDATANPTAQIGGYLKVLIERFGLLERQSPIFAKSEAKRGRYYMTDNFLRSWLSALANPVAAIAFRPAEELIDEADRRLADAEGIALEKLVGQLYDERSRRGLGDFSLTHRIQGYWDKSDTEIDLVAVNDQTNTIRFGSCKRSAVKLLADVNRFKQHVARFVDALPQYRRWQMQLAGIAPVLSAEERAHLIRHDCIPQDLHDLTLGL